MVKGSLYDWRKEMIERGFSEEEKQFGFDRLTDEERLRKSGLPYFKSLVINYTEFSRNNAELMGYLSKIPSFFLKVLPKTGLVGFPRTFNPKVHSFNEAEIFLSELFCNNPEYAGKEKHYTLTFMEHEPADFGGVVISNPRSLLIELLRESHDSTGKIIGGLSGISLGEDPEVSCRIDHTGIGHLEDKARLFIRKEKHIQEKRFYLKDCKSDERLKTIWEVLNYLRITPDNFNIKFWEGYFEWLHTPTKGVVFWDYKANPIFYEPSPQVL